MPKVYLLGATTTYADPVTPPPSFVAVSFRDPGVTAGGWTHVASVADPSAVNPVYPVVIHAVFVPTSEIGSLVNPSDPQSYLGSAYPQASSGVNSATAYGADMGPPLGYVAGTSYTVQLIGEYNV